MSIDFTRLTWRKSTRSNGGSACVEVACVADATWHKSSRSTGNGQCVEVAGVGATIAIRDSKLDNSGHDFPHLTLAAADWSALLTGIRSGELIG